jgi:hypothetical protein
VIVVDWVRCLWWTRTLLVFSAPDSCGHWVIMYSSRNAWSCMDNGFSFSWNAAHTSSIFDKYFNGSSKVQVL